MVNNLFVLAVAGGAPLKKNLLMPIRQNGNRIRVLISILLGI
jgi:hypothetical protein